MATLLRDPTNEGNLEKIGSVCERILSYGICFMFSLLEDPNIWRSSMIPIEDCATGEETKDEMEAERFCENVLFT